MALNEVRVAVRAKRFSGCRMLDSVRAIDRRQLVIRILVAPFPECHCPAQVVDAVQRLDMFVQEMVALR